MWRDRITRSRVSFGGLSVSSELMQVWAFGGLRRRNRSRPPPSAKDDNFKICVALTNDLEVVCVAVADAVDADEDGDGEKDERGDGVRALVRCVQRAVVPGEADGGEVFGEAGMVMASKSCWRRSAGSEPKMRAGSGAEPSRSLGIARSGR